MLFTRFWRSAWKQRWCVHDHGGPTGYADTLTSVEERA
jgi:MATE family multidrug resistance protein